MMCQWDSLLGVLPLWLRNDVNELGKMRLRELRLRINAPPELNFGAEQISLNRVITREDLLFCVNTASRYSPWAAETISRGYLTIAGGHRLGICGEGIYRNGAVSGIRDIRSINLRVARDFPGIAASIRPEGSVLILGPPGSGKTTLLRDLARQTARKETVSVVDERGELFPEGIQQGNRTDILSGCPKAQGIDMVLRTMNPDWIVLDEITNPEDVQTLLLAQGCGVRLMATAHGFSQEDLRRRPVYRPLWEQNIFQTILIMNRNKSFVVERNTPCHTNGSELCLL